MIADFQHQAIAAHVAQQLSGPARAIAGLQELLVEQVHDRGFVSLAGDVGRIGVAAGELLDLIDRLLQGRGEYAADAEMEIEAQLRHDLRTPLNAIIGYSEMLFEEAQDLNARALQDDIRAILSAAADLLVLVDDIARLSRGDLAAAIPAGGYGQGIDAAGLERALASHAPRRSPGRILVVDDVRGNRDLLARRLRRDGHLVVAADTGAAALERLAAQDYDLVLLDILMPDMNGIEVLARLKSDGRWKHIPVIMISGLSEVDAVARCLEGGADDYLTKPFNPVLLRARITSALEKKRWIDRERGYLRQIESEKRRADALLEAILPGQIVARLQGGERVIADRYDAATILFADIVGFSTVAARIAATELIRRLDELFGMFDRLAEEHGVEKIKTIGDAYMAAGGIPEKTPDHADRVVALGSSMLEALQRTGEDRFRIRIGVHTGPVIAGLIGKRRFVYDVWGETVNIASRLESQGAPDRMQISEATRRAMHDTWPLEPQGATELKGIGTIGTYFVSG
jgi:class 3 adenylate cyclase